MVSHVAQASCLPPHWARKHATKQDSKNMPYKGFRSLTLSHFQVSKSKAVELKVRLIVSLLLATRVVILVLSLTVAVSVSVTLSNRLTVLCLTASFGLAVRTAGGGRRRASTSLAGASTSPAGASTSPLPVVVSKSTTFLM